MLDIKISNLFIHYVEHFTLLPVTVLVPLQETHSCMCSSPSILLPITSLLKSYETDIKSKIFSTNEVQMFVNNKALSGALVKYLDWG